MHRVFAVERAAIALRAVGDELQAFALTDRGDGWIIGGLAEQIDGDDRLGLQFAVLLHARDRGFERGRIHVVGIGQHIDEHWRRVGPRHDLGGRSEGEARAEDSVAFADAPRPKRQHERVSAVGVGDAVL